MSEYRDGVRQERSGWRDESYSRWHRTLGKDLVAMDIDYVEYYNWQPVAIIEVKADGCKPVKWSDPSIKMYQLMAAKLEIPAFCVKHSKDLTSFFVVSLNQKAMDITRHRKTMMDQEEYVTFLYRLRGIEPDMAEKELFDIFD